MEKRIEEKIAKSDKKYILGISELSKRMIIVAQHMGITMEEMNEAFREATKELNIHGLSEEDKKMLMRKRNIYRKSLSYERRRAGKKLRYLKKQIWEEIKSWFKVFSK